MYPRRLLSIFFLAFIAVAGGGVWSGLSAQPAQAQQSVVPPMFVGQIPDLDAYIGFATNGNFLTGYVCDGAANTLADTFDGAASAGSGGTLTLATESGLSLSLNVDGNSLPAIITSGGSIAGTLTTPDGVAHAFTAVPATGPGAVWIEDDETLADGTSSSGGWIVLNDGSIRGSTGHVPANAGNSPNPPTKTTGMNAGPGGTNATSNIVLQNTPPNTLADLSTPSAPAVAQAMQVSPQQQPQIQLTLPVSTGPVISQTVLNIPRVPCNDPLSTIACPSYLLQP